MCGRRKTGSRKSGSQKKRKGRGSSAKRGGKRG